MRDIFFAWNHPSPERAGRLLFLILLTHGFLVVVVVVVVIVVVIFVSSFTLILFPLIFLDFLNRLHRLPLWRFSPGPGRCLIRLFPPLPFSSIVNAQPSYTRVFRIVDPFTARSSASDNVALVNPTQVVVVKLILKVFFILVKLIIVSLAVPNLGLCDLCMT
ncbi:hypothetical protein BC826DRAFT_1052746 [Russula brevipes]|nr:hypothetical protein BC826DRAFT_1052746 [Russula brevipes]